MKKFFMVAGVLVGGAIVVTSLEIVLGMKVDNKLVLNPLQEGVYDIIHFVWGGALILVTLPRK